MYIKLALVVMALCGGLLQAQVTDSLSTKDSLYSKIDTVYIQQPPLIIRRQVVDTLAEFASPNLEPQQQKHLNLPDLYVDATVGLDHWLGDDIALDSSTHFHKKMGYSAAVSLGAEIGSFHVAAGLGLQQINLDKILEKMIASYDTTIIYKEQIRTTGIGQNCRKEGNQYKCIVGMDVKIDTIVTKTQTLLSRQHTSYLNIPLKFGRKFFFDQWYLSPELMAMPMLSLTSATSSESTYLKFESRSVAYRLSLLIGRKLGEKTTVELGASYQSTLKYSALQMNFINLHFSLKYYIFKGTP